MWRAWWQHQQAPPLSDRVTLGRRARDICYPCGAHPNPDGIPWPCVTARISWPCQLQRSIGVKIAMTSGVGSRPARSAACDVGHRNAPWAVPPDWWPSKFRTRSSIDRIDKLRCSAAFGSHFNPRIGAVLLLRPCVCPAVSDRNDKPVSLLSGEFFARMGNTYYRVQTGPLG